MSSIYNDAVANWPEDEASMSASYGLDLFEMEGRDEYHAWLIKERGCLKNLFDDDEKLIERFMVKFNALTAGTTNLYI
jgi:hypothetical protein